ncbi:M14 family zinc carboxypeptidase [Flavobacteriaceae bacterium]|nr:M14 family zinc carboxypeptidase [Flavobacteriaceae bacterium]
MSSKYLTNDDLHLNRLNSKFKISKIGCSVNNEDINVVKVGNGNIKVLAWSQMHGNESTSTKSLLDFINALNNDEFINILDACTLHLIPILNPDGARTYTRENYNKVDLNRDAKINSQPESRVLNDYFLKIKPDYCFNLHDQRTIYGSDNDHNPSGLSFLSPFFDSKGSININRRESMFIIEHIYIKLSNVIKDRVRLYNDDYNENCFGDHFQNKGSSTILFESGFFENDYNREITRKYMFHSLVIALELISNEINSKIKVDIYELIPKNKVKFYDIILKKIKIDDSIINVGINYKEILKGNSISFVPYIESIGDLDNFLGHKEFEFPSNYFKTFNSNTFIVGNKLNESLIKLLNI